MMYSARLTNGLVLEDASMRGIYKQAERWKRASTGSLHGRVGYTLFTPAGEVVLEVKDGHYMTLTEVNASGRLYNVVIRTLRSKGIMMDCQTDIELADLRKFVIEGHLKKARNAGTKTYAELFRILEDYTGWNDDLQAALADYMKDTPMGRHWLNVHCAGLGDLI